MSSIPLLVVDDHPMIIEGLEALLRGVSHIRIHAKATSLADARAVLFKEAPHIKVALVDIRLQDGLGIDLVRELREKYPHIEAIGLTMYDTEEYLEALVKAGAKGYLLKHVSQQELIEAIEQVVKGHYYFSKGVQDVIGEHILRRRDEPHKDRPKSALRTEEGGAIHLTRREREILELIAQELTNAQIAEKLGLSPRTVHTHRRGIMQKLGVRNTAGLVRYALENDLVDPKKS